MSVVTQLVGFGLRQVIGDFGDDVVQVVVAVEQYFRDHSRTLPKALNHAHQRAWQALGVALAGDGLLDRVKVFFASGDDKGIREQVQLFLKSNAVSFDGTGTAFRQDCLDELKRLRKSGLLSTDGEISAEIASQAAGFRRHADPHGLIEESRRAVAGVADALADGYPNLAKLLRTPTPAGPPLLGAAFCYFFRREVETDDELAHGLFFDDLRRLSASQAQAFDEVGKALAALGEQFDALFEQLGRIETAVVETHAVAVETHGAVLDLQTELQRLGGLHLTNTEEVRSLLLLVQQQLSLVGMHRGEVRPQLSLSIQGDYERQAVKELFARFRVLPAAERRQVPALLNGLGKLQVGTGDFGAARLTFTEVGQVVADQASKAEAFFNAYRAALEDQKWEEALEAINQAASLDEVRFAPFPVWKYKPVRILGAGGFGTAFLCREWLRGIEVVIKSLHAAPIGRRPEQVFSEAIALGSLQHPAFVRVLDCDYADSTGRLRPYIVMDFFDGLSLERFVQQKGPLPPKELLLIAGLIADGMKAAHDRDVFHRDLKPANILVRRGENCWDVKIIDFGLAHRGQGAGTSRFVPSAADSIFGRSMVGTFLYAPPEQMGRLPEIKPGPFSDIYSFGKVCLFALTGMVELLGCNRADPVEFAVKGASGS